MKGAFQRLLAMLPFLLPFLSIHGCAKAEAKLLDLASLMFIMFCMVVFWCWATPKIVTHPYYKSLHELFRPVLKVSLFLSVIVGIGLIVTAFFSEGLDRIQFFIGFVFILLGFFIHMYIKLFEEQEHRKTYFKLMSISMGFLIALFFLWIKGIHVLRL